MEVDEWLKRYESIRNWFIKPNGERRYTPATEKQYIEYMKLYQQFTGKTPDELANCEDVDKMRGIIADGLRAKPLKICSVTYRLHPLNSFWRYNGRRTNDVYGGIRPDLRFRIERLRKWSPTEMELKERKTES